MRIRILTTGGSIDKRYSTQDSDFLVGEPSIEAMLKEANVNLDFVIEPLFRKDSLQITDEDRALIVERARLAPESHLIVTHGTDTMVQTAKALSVIQDKTIVLTGAMQPSAFKQTDAFINVGGALIAVQTLVHGVYIVMSGRVFRPDATQKNMQTDQFEEI